MDSDTGQQVQASKEKRVSERQANVSRLISSYRDEAKQLLKDVLRAQNRWCRELGNAVFAGLPGLERPPKTGGHYVRRRLPWRQVERDALKRHLMGLGLGRWREIHAILTNSVRGFKHGPGDVEDACWQLLLECQLMLQAPEDRLYLARVMEAVADKGPVYTPGAPFSKVETSAKGIVRRLMLLEELNALMPSFMRSEAVVGIFRALVQMLPASSAPAAWWNIEADVALMVGVHRHGYTNFETIRKDPVLQGGFQGYHPSNEQKGKPSSRAASPGADNVTEPPTPQHQAASDAEPAVSIGVGTPGPATSEDGAATAAAPSTAAAAASAANVWPTPEALSKRVRFLSDLVAQAVAIAEANGLLLPPTEAAPGPSYEKQGTKVVPKLLGILPYAATATAAASGTLDWDLPGLVPGAATAAGAAAGLAAAGARPSRMNSAGALDRMSGDVALSDQMDLNEGDLDGLLGDLASPGPYELSQHHGGKFGHPDEEDESSEEEEEPLEQDVTTGPGFGSYFSTGLQRTRGGRPRKGTKRGLPHTEPAAAAAGGDDDGVTEGRGRAHRPSRRYADAVLLNLEPGDAAYGTGASQGETGSHEVTKKARRELLNLVQTWGPPDATGDAARAAGGAAGADPTAAAVAMAAAGADYDWDAWSGAGGLTGPLQKMSQAELTVMLRELLAEMDELATAASAAAAAGLNRVRNAHQPNCDCIVCTNRRNAEQRKREAQGGSEATAAAAVESAEAEEAAAAAATAAAAAPTAAKAKPLPKGEVLTGVTAGRLQERIELMSLFRSVVGLVGTGQLEAAFKKGAKDLPAWWSPQLDVGLVVGIVQHGFGNWSAIFEDDQLPFKAAASAAGATGYDVDPNDPAAAAAMGDAGARQSTAKAKAGLPDWVPDPKVLSKRCKMLVTAIKSNVLGSKAGTPNQQKGGKGFAEDATGVGGKAKGSKSKGGKAGGGGGQRGVSMVMMGPGLGVQMQMGPGMGQLDPSAAAQLQHMQQFAAMGMLPQGMAAGGAAGAAGNSNALQQILAQRFGGVALQPMQQRMLLQQQQMSIAGQVLGKRSAAEAGLPESGQLQKAAAAGPGGSGLVATQNAGGSDVTAQASAGSAAGAAAVSAIIAAVAPGLTPAQVSVLEHLPQMSRTSTGQPKLPLVVTNKLTLLALGKIDPSRPAFHNNSRIFPIGLQTAVQYPSSVNPGSETKYTCVVADGAVAGAAGPLFLVVAADAPGQQWLAQSPQAVWQQIHTQVQQTQQAPVPATDGLQQFGLSHPLVAMLIQELPAADQCAAYRPSESPAPPQMAAAMRRLHAASAGHVGLQQHHQQQQQEAPGGAAGQAAAAMQTAALRAQLLQQQLARMQQGSQPQQQQQPQQMLHSSAPMAVSAGISQQQQPQQQQLLQIIQQQKLMQQHQLIQQQVAAQQQLQQQQRRLSGDGQQQQQQQQQAAGVGAAGAVQQLMLLHQRQQQLAQQPGNVNPQQGALLQQMALARAANAVAAGGPGRPQQQQQVALTPQQLQQQQLMRQALAAGLHSLKQQQQGTLGPQ